MKYSAQLKYCDCPICGKQLINLTEGDPMCEENEYMYWCDVCNVDITIIVNEEDE